jgi:hypothetical protein
LANIKINYGNYGRIMALQIRRRSFIKRGNYGKQLYTSRLLKYKDLSQPKNSNKVTIISNDSNDNYGNYLILLSYINFNHSTSSLLYLL